LIEFALTGSVSPDSVELVPEDIWINGKTAAQVLPTLRAGTITRIEGLEEIRNHPEIVSVFPQYRLGDTITETHNVKQRFCEIDVVCDTDAQAAERIRWVYDTLKIFDENGQDMIVSRFDPDLFLERNS